MNIIRSVSVICFTFIIFLTASTSVFAQEQNTKFYFSVNLGNVDYSDAGSLITDLENEFSSIGFTSDFTYDDSDRGMRLTGGFQATENVAFTLSYVDLGSFTFSGFASNGIDVVDITDASIDTSGLEIAALFSLNMPDNNFVPYARLGLFKWDADFGFTVSSTTLPAAPQRVTESDDGNDIVIGLGASYFVGSNIGIGVSWDRYDLDGTNVDFMSASLIFKN